MCQNFFSIFLRIPSHIAFQKINVTLWEKTLLNSVILVMRKGDYQMKVLIEKLRNGMEKQETSRILGIPRITVQGVWRRYKERGQVDDMPKIGRPMCTADRDRRNLCLQSRRHPFLTAREVQHSSLSMLNMYSGDHK